jgi:hypothetical protein
MQNLSCASKHFLHRLSRAGSDILIPPLFSDRRDRGEGPKDSLLTCFQSFYKKWHKKEKVEHNMFDFLNL